MTYTEVCLLSKHCQNIPMGKQYRRENNLEMSIQGNVKTRELEKENNVNIFADIYKIARHRPSCPECGYMVQHCAC